MKLRISILGKTKKNSHNLSINQNDTLITDDLLLVSLFNNYFSRIGSELRHQIPNDGRNPLTFFDETDKKVSALSFYEYTLDEVSMLNSKFSNKGSSPDKIHTLIYKKMSHIQAPFISELLNMSIMESIFPSCLKIGRVIQISKSGKKDQLTNYKPITTLPVLAIFFEKNIPQEKDVLHK